MFCEIHCTLLWNSLHCPVKFTALFYAIYSICAWNLLYFSAKFTVLSLQIYCTVLYEIYCTVLWNSLHCPVNSLCKQKWAAGFTYYVTHRVYSMCTLSKGELLIQLMTCSSKWTVICSLTRHLAVLHIKCRKWSVQPPSNWPLYHLCDSKICSGRTQMVECSTMSICTQQIQKNVSETSAQSFTLSISCLQYISCVH